MYEYLHAFKSYVSLCLVMSCKFGNHCETIAKDYETGQPTYSTLSLHFIWYAKLKQVPSNKSSPNEGDNSRSLLKL